MNNLELPLKHTFYKGGEFYFYIIEVFLCKSEFFITYVYCTKDKADIRKMPLSHWYRYKLKKIQHIQEIYSLIRKTIINYYLP